MRLGTLVGIVVASLCYTALPVYVSLGPRPIPQQERWVSWGGLPIILIAAGYSFMHCGEFASLRRGSADTLKLRLLAFLCFFTLAPTILGLAATLLFPLAIILIPAFLASMLLIFAPALLQNAPLFRKYLRYAVLTPLAFLCYSLLARAVELARGT